MKLQLKYKGKNLWGQPIYQDPQGRLYRNVDMSDNNNLNSIRRTQSPFYSVAEIHNVKAVEITHEDGHVDTINVAQYNEDNKPYNTPACLSCPDGAE